MASTDATPIPVKNQACRITFPILDADGDLVTGATGLDSEVSKDGGTFTDCSAEATEIATASGMYYLDLTATEMNADTVAIIVKTTSSGAKTTPMIMYPNKSGGLAVNVTAWAGNATTTGDIAIKTTLAKTTHITGFNDISTANVQTELTTYGALKPTVAARTLDVSTTGEAGVDWANVGGQGTTVGLSATTIATVTNATNVTNPVALTSAYDAAKTAATQASVTTLTGYVDTEVAAILAAVDTEVASILAKVNNLPTDPADASDIAASFATLNGKVDVVDDFLDTEIAAIKAKTDQLVFTVANRVDASASLSLTAGDLTSIADAILKRDFTAVSGEALYSLLNAARLLRNAWATTGGTLTVKKEDGSTTAWTRTLSTDPAADPITGAS